MLWDMNISDTRKNLMKMPEMLAEDQGTVAVTRGGKPVLAVMSWELYESITETLEILSDEEMMDSLRQGVKEAEGGMGISWEEAKQELGW